jgi:hypothetical protein
MARKKDKPEETKWTPVVGEAEPAEGTVGPAEEVAVDLDEFEPHRKPNKAPVGVDPDEEDSTA